MMTDIRLTDEPTPYVPDQEFRLSWEAEENRAAGEVKIKAYVPDWLREGIAAGVESRKRNIPQSAEFDEPE